MIHMVQGSIYSLHSLKFVYYSGISSGAQAITSDITVGFKFFDSDYSVPENWTLLNSSYH